MNHFPSIEHVDIPYDQLKIFQKSVNDDSHQQILIQTLLLSSLAKLHHHKNTYKINLIVTAKFLWIIINHQKKNKIPSKDIQFIVKSNRAPQIVIVTKSSYNNIRLSTSSEARCNAIISGISYQFSIMSQKQLPLIKVDSAELTYFERTFQQKAQGKNINFKPYPKNMVKYEKPFNGTVIIYGNLKFTDRTKIILQKQIPIDVITGRQNHKIYIARIIQQNPESFVNGNTRKSFHMSSDSKSFDNDIEENYKKYICHYISRRNSYMQQIYQYNCISFIQELICARAIDFKVQLFFQYAIPLKHIQPTPTIFRTIWDLYDKIIKLDQSRVISTDLFLIVDREPLIVSTQNKQRDIILNRDLRRVKSTKQSLTENGTYLQIVIKQFRYEFLREGQILDKFIFELSPQYKPPQQTVSMSFMRKMYTMGIILYELFMGKNPFEYLVPKKKGNFEVNEKNEENFQKFEQFEKQNYDLLITLKSQIQYLIPKTIFPEFSEYSFIATQTQKDIIQKLIYRKFAGEKQLFGHQWFQ